MIRKIIHALGIVFVLVALFFVFEKIWANRQWFLDGRITKEIILVIAVGSVFYALSSFLLSKAWSRFLIWFGESRNSVKHCHAIYARTQIAKYMPGNVFHYAGRHLLGSQAGMGHGALAGAAVYEIVGLLVASSFLAIVGIVFYGVNHMKISVMSLVAIFIVTLMIPVIFNSLIIRFPKLREFNFQDKKIGEIIRCLIPTYTLYIVFFVITGAILVQIVQSVSGLDNIHQVGYVVTTFAVAWIAGNVTPGASAGIGIREAVIVVSFTALIGEPESLFIALILRMITVMGDVIYFLTSFAVKLDLFEGKPCNTGQLAKNDAD